MASQITSLTVVYSTVYSDADQRKHQSSASLAFVRGIHRDRWIPRTKGQLRGKCFHLMTSSWLFPAYLFTPVYRVIVNEYSHVFNDTGGPNYIYFMSVATSCEKRLIACYYVSQRGPFLSCVALSCHAFHFLVMRCTYVLFLSLTVRREYQQWGNRGWCLPA